MNNILPADNMEIPLVIANLAQIKHRISAACKNASRDENAVRLLLATKTVAIQKIRAAIEAGEMLIGENKT